MASMRPMLATRGTSVPAGEGWRHEVKWDGMRVIVAARGGTVRVTSRNENDVTVSFPELRALTSAQALGGSEAVLDGEVVALLDGIPVFGALADRIHVTSARKAEEAMRHNPVTLLAFDLLQLDGHDVRELPWDKRRDALEQILPAGPSWQVPPTYDDGKLLMGVTKQRGLEGVVSKRVSSPYRSGVRSADWLKFPHRDSVSVVVGGWRPETESARLGALLVGEPTEDGLVYRGRVGSGLAGRAGERVAALLSGLETGRSPFTSAVPEVDARGATWVKPQLVVEVASLGMTPQRRLRQPAFLAVRKDLAPDDLPELGSLDG